jgi:hypothetical protein
MAFSVAQVARAKAFRISPTDTNYFVMLFDQETDREYLRYRDIHDRRRDAAERARFGTRVLPRASW